MRSGKLALDFSRAQGGTQISFLRLCSSVMTHPGMLAVTLYRCQERVQKRGFGRLARFLRVLNNALSGADLLPGSEIGGGFVMQHPTGIVVGSGVVIGRDCTILQNVTIGEKNADGRGLHAYPSIGNGVVIGAGAVLLGDITVGNNSTIAANAVVLQSVPPDSIAIGAPAKSRPRV